MRFMLLLKSDEQSEAGVPPTEGLIGAMVKYNEELLQAGALLAGEGLMASSKGARVKFSKGKPVITDGPFAEAKEIVAGYWIIQADSKADAIDWAKRIPFEAGETAGAGSTGEVEIRQLYELEDFPVSEEESGWREREAEFRDRGPEVGQSAAGKRFIIFRMADDETEAETEPAPSEELLAKMGAYNDEMIRAGVMLGGEGLQPTSKGARVRYAKGKRTVIDGPFTEARELVAGFTLIQANSLAEALGWAKRWPPEDTNGEVELAVREVFGAADFGSEFTPELREAEERQRAQVARNQ
jgi:hypothetical protein